MLRVEITTQFKRDLKLAKRRNKNLLALKDIMKQIEAEKSLDKKYKDHTLIGYWHGHRECHIEPDWLLIYKLIPTEKMVIFTRTGSHADLFD
ncbi:MAG TPA: type II toxin-antitoxin system YafQ family toxin [Gammaproteobacteria bacterium]|nr:type II toxin-antitoxin system YafQ family toxin [Gammaproteobacteria bacterium]